ncbi:hypothetical protein NQ318_015164 [Aromia moschata]|uniref:protein disulfide-isomerase n=1 Tax=Aromia moschata TaxID=1265417 RepID=A0AAV8XXM9_9CUCU|nr:hypothetical protein NQ318_015164 [Aromia moschata]
MLFYDKLLVCFIFLEVVHGSQDNSNVTTLTNENFNEKVFGADTVWVVKFCSHKNKDCQDFEEEFSISANVLKNIVKFGEVNLEENSELAKNFSIDLKLIPVIKIFGILQGDQDINYAGPNTARDLVDSILTSILNKIKAQFGEILPENLIQEVNDKNFDQIITSSSEPWLVQFYAPWCVHCKDLKPIWEQAAVYLKGKIKFASLDATVNKLKAKEYKIDAYPTVKLLPSGQKSPKTAIQYTNERSVTDIVNWVEETLPGPDVLQITASEGFKRSCITKKLCIIGILPHILDCKSTFRQNYLSILKHLGETYKKHDWGWMWSEANAQKPMEDLLNVGGFGYPTLVVLNSAKKKYSVFKGAFTMSNVNEFLLQLAKTKAAPLEQDIASKIVEVDVWDGTDHEDSVAKDEL